MIKFVTEAEFDEVTREGIWIADFYTEHCGPCKVLDTVIDQVIFDNPEVNLAKCDIEKDPALQKRFKIFGTPTLIFLNDGQIKDSWSGAWGRDKVEESLAKCMYE